MNETLKQSVDLFVENEEIAANNYFWEHEENDAVCALEYSAKGKKIDIARMKEADNIIKHKVNMFSELRGSTYHILATQMAQSDDMEAYFNHVKEVYDLVVKGKWFSNPYYMVATLLIVQHSEGDINKAKEIIEKMKSIYARMNKNHPFLTNEEDMGLAVLLAVTDLPEDDLVNEMEDCFKYLKNQGVGSSNTVQSLSHVLSLKKGNTKAKCDKVIALNYQLRTKDKRFTNDYEQCILGALALTDVDTKTLVDEIVEVDNYLLKQTKTFGMFRLGKDQALMYAGILVMGEYCKQMSDTTANALAIVVATQLVMLMILMDEIFITNMMLMSAAHR